MVQGQTGNTRKAESQDRPLWSLARPHCLGAIHRRRHSYRPRFLQNTTRMDNGSAAGRQIRTIPRLESIVWTDLVKYHKSI